MCFSSLSRQCIPPTPGEAQMEGASLRGSAGSDLSASWLERQRMGGKGLWGEPAPLCAVGTASCQHSPACDEALSHTCSLPSQWCSGCRGTAMDLHTQAGQGCSCSILSSIHYENWIYGSWVSLHFHIFLCRRTSFPLSCYITLG